MFVYFYENKDMVLNQVRNTVPAVGDDLKIKGRKAKVLSVEHADDNKVHVQVSLEKVSKKSKVIEDPSKKRKR
ncbi:hypothetical protein GCM10008967_38530 [Bacillus carboniphilus]|uniref:Preprotein translocase subunit SecA n=1 Tax=Bacillus carboniphilus TaxID=86663 RepID=A0ABP3GI57_9BACI